MNVIKALWARLMDGIREEDHGYGSLCWVWTKSMTSDGYGHIRIGSRTDGTRRMQRTHVLMYELIVGPMPDGMVTDHLCRVRACCNPWHLEAVTRKENVLRGSSPDALRRRFAAMTTCSRGHPYSEANTYLWVNPRGHTMRHCRVCKNERRRVLT